ncbi:DUF4097 family beta strand repeat-containing protein [Leifsonia sp. YAF41]|uniref:DUF4097 family beta strand repeat-containing protein n=1 Tax=Leifsonia sp. YAF41 TaxID=3233086 RepID=UPI003F996E2F
MTLEKWLVTPGQTKIIDIELVRHLKVSLIAGRVDVIGHDEPGARVTVHSVSGKDLKISMDGDLLEIDHPQLRWDNFIEVFSSFRGSARADVSIMVPRDIALKFGVISADALVSGLANDARISTVTGDVVIDGSTGALELNSVSGELSVRSHTGDISAHTVSGDVTVSGNIRRFSVDGVSGNVFVDIDGVPDRINTNSVSGNLTVRLGADVPARYRINTVSGTLQLDDRTVRGTLGKGFDSSIGDLSGSWLELNAKSVSGDVSVVRRADSSGQNSPTDASHDASTFGEEGASE